MIYTFYSYKGGVGRSMALANVAEWLYLRGLRVVVIDWDLEAPGLESFFFTESSQLTEVHSQLGLMDALLTYKRQYLRLVPTPVKRVDSTVLLTDVPSDQLKVPLPPTQRESTAEEREEKELIAVLHQNLPPLSDFLYPVHAPPSTSDTQQSGALWLLPSGWRAGDQFSTYAQAVQSFDWTDFYTSFEGATYFEWMREQLANVADVVLIDSRTGVTEMGGVCTRQLADAVISLCVPNNQNLSGVVRMIRSFVRDDVREEREKHGHSLPQIAVIPTRIELTEHDLRQEFKSNFIRELQEIDGFRLDPEAFWKLRIPYVPKYAYAEDLAIGDDAASEELVEAYEKLAAYLATLALKDPLWTQTTEKARQDRLSIAAERVLGRILARSGVFLSYARSDGEKLANLVRLELEKVGIQVWRETEMMKGGIDWWSQITEGLGQVEYLVFLATPDALGSSTQRSVLRYARQQGVCVLPVKGSSQLDFADLPRWLVNLHFYDLGQAPVSNPAVWKRFVTQLHTPCNASRVPFMAEDLPPDFVERPAEIERLLSLFLAGKRNEPAAITVALSGAGGFGKTVLARALCHNERIQDVFEDGILWVTLGANPGDLTGRIADLINVLSGERPTFVSLDAATNRLVELLADRVVLLVIDDVWNSEHLRPFTLGGPRCARLITTRNHDVISSRVNRVNLESMHREEAVALLGAGLPTGGEADLRQLADRLGAWPLVLKLVNSALRERVSSAGQPLSDAIDFANKALDRRGLTFFDARYAISREQGVSISLGLSLELLNQVERDRFTELAVFPEDIAIPLATVTKLWGATNKFDEFDTEELCERLARLSLLARFDPTQRSVRLHPAVRAYLLTLLTSNQLPHLHGQLLDAHQTTRKTSDAPTPWAAMSAEEPYLWNHLAFHLTNAGRGAELVDTVLYLPYLIEKTKLCGARAVEADLRTAYSVAHQHPVLYALLREFSRTAHILNRIGAPDDLATTLYSRLHHLSDAFSYMLQLESALPRPYLAPWHSLPDQPVEALLRTLAGHTARVNGCAIDAQGSFIVSASDDKTLKIWDVAESWVRLTLTGHSDGATGCAISPDGSFIVSASSDHTLKVWDSWTGEERMTLRGHKDGVTACAISPDGSYIVSASNDKTVMIWDTKSGSPLFTLGHEEVVAGCAVSPGGAMIASVSSHSLRFWNARTGALSDTLKFRGTLTGCAFSPDGSVVVATSSNRTLTVLYGREPLILKGHEKEVNGCAVSPDNSFVVSASSDQTLKVWDLKRGTERSTLRGHTAWVKACAISPDGTRIVSASNDHTLKIWDAEAPADQATPVGHRAWVRACAVSPDGTRLISVSDDRTLKQWDVASGDERLSILAHKASVRDCAVSSDSSFVVSASSDRTLKVFTREGIEFLKLKGHTNTVNGCAISPDNSFIVSASSDHTLKVWDARSGEKRLTLSGHADAVTACAISGDCKSIVSVSVDGTIKVWDSRNGELLQSLSGHAGPIYDCAISLDGSLLVSASSDKTLKIWHLDSGKLQRSLEGHAATVSGCALNSDNTLLASVSWDRTLKVWDVRSGKCLASFYAEGVLLDCAWLPNSQNLVAVGGGGVYWLQLIST